MQELPPMQEIETTRVKEPVLTKSRLSQNTQDNSRFQKWHNLKRWQKGTIVTSTILLFFLTIATVIGLYTFQQVKKIQAQTLELQVSGRTMYDSFKAQNLPAVNVELQKIKGQLAEVEQTYGQLKFYSYIPLARTYYLDGQSGLNAAKSGISAAEKSLNAIVPYADVLGFSGEGTFTGGTTEDRLKVILETLDKITPVIDDISKDLSDVEKYLAEIDETNYPENLRGRPVRSYIIQAKELSSGAVTAVTEYRPVLEQLPSVAGGKGVRKKYLILFQNDNELRPTGGFLTAYATIFIENGKVEAEKSDDIYELDKKFKKNIPIPEALGRYLTTEKRWNLRDMNISPDFKESMTQFYTHYQEVPGEPSDIAGIIAVDTEFLLNLLTVLGPVEVPGYGTYSAEIDPKCDCPQIIYALSEIITRPTPYLRTDRKGVLGPLMRAILTKAYGAPKQQWPELFETGFESIAARHAQFYFFDEAAQTAAEKANAAGLMQQKDPSADFFAVINANLGGAKSNLFTEYDIKQVVSAPENGMITKTVEITYKNPRKGDNCNLEAGLLCLNSTLRDWTRIYLPKGSQLQSAQGFTQEAKATEEGNFTVIDGFFILEPLGTAKLVLTYTVPYTNTENYKLEVWKQGGIKEYKLFMDVNGGQEEMVITKDTTVEAAF